MVLKWFIRFDDRRQRYNIKDTKRLKKRRKYNRKKRGWEEPETVKDMKALAKVPRVPPPPMPKMIWRSTQTLNFVMHHRYYAMRLQRWAEERHQLVRHYESDKEEVARAIEKFTRFRREDWWFPHTVGLEIRKVPYNPNLIGKKEGPTYERLK